MLVYQAWTYWVFRKRIGTHHIPSAETCRGREAARMPALDLRVLPTCGRPVTPWSGRWSPASSAGC